MPAIGVSGSANRANVSSAAEGRWFLAGEADLTEFEEAYSATHKGGKHFYDPQRHEYIWFFGCSAVRLSLTNTTFSLM